MECESDAKVSLNFQKNYLNKKKHQQAINTESEVIRVRNNIKLYIIIQDYINNKSIKQLHQYHKNGIFAFKLVFIYN